MNAFGWIALIFVLLAFLTFIIGGFFIYYYTNTKWWVLLIWAVTILFICLALLFVITANSKIMSKMTDMKTQVTNYFTQPRAPGQPIPLPGAVPLPTQ